MKLLLTLLLVAVFCMTAMGQITKIKDIQFTEDPSGDSPLKGQTVTISGIVTAEHRGDVYANGGISGSYFFMADSAAAWCGIQVYFSDSTAAQGDSITLTGKVDEYFNLTEIVDVTEFIRHSSGHELPGPVDVTTADLDTSEAYEGCYVRVNDVTITETGIGSYNNWTVDDGSGVLKIDTRALYYYTPVLGDSVKSITGVVLYGYGEFTLAPRLAWDIVEGGEYTRIQRIQQVRNSDLLRTPVDNQADFSYGHLDTFKIKGVVTVPTGLSYAGAGIKFILSEPGGGPWSGILSYNPDSTAYPTLFEGDLIEMSGYIDEYVTDPSNMTEFWILSPIEILDVDQPLPVPDTIATGDLRWPVTAEQWGNVMVAVKNASVKDINPPSEPYGMFSVDDNTGEIWIDHDSDSLLQWFNSGGVMPVGTIYESIKGWVYNHFGAYADSSTYKLAPNYVEDLVVGSAPPQIGKVTRDPGIPSSSDFVTVSTTLKTNFTITSAMIHYSVNGQAYQEVAMSPTTGDIWSGTIPTQATGTRIDYFVRATDDHDGVTLAPPDTSELQYTYYVKDEGLTIKDVQYSTWPIADSPFEGCEVMITGVVTNDTSANNIFRAYTIQSEPGKWNGLFAFGINSDLNRGDEITIFGTVTDYNADYHSKWDNNTVVLVDSHKVMSTGNSVDVVEVTPGELTQNAESYEGVLVKISNVTLDIVNPYDASFKDESGSCRVDGDFMLARDQDPNPIFYVNDTDKYLVAWGDTIYPGEQISGIQGIFTYSFGTYKISLRNSHDFGVSTGLNPDFHPTPLTYDLNQNFPNPFNPETRISFEIPEAQTVKLIIYNVLGQKVRTLINEPYNAGRHVVNWDGRDSAGSRVPSGMYFYRIKAGNFIATKKMLMVK